MTNIRLIMRALVLLVPYLVTLGVLVPGLVQSGEDQGTEFQASLRGFQEVPATSTGARGKVRMEISEGGTSITYTLSYSGLEGDVRQAHIHFGQRSVNGGIAVFLCQTTFNPDPTGHAPTCPQSGTVTGTLTAANMTTLAVAQGIAPSEFAELVRAIRAGVTYANVHSAGTTVPANFAGGEIRGQIRKHDDDNDDESGKR